jgi:HK97 family phage portal protein
MKLPFLRWLGKARDRPANSLFGSTYSFFFGTTSSGKTVNERTAMQTAAVYACVRILCETVASLPLHTYRHTVGGKEKAKNHRLYYLLHDEPNPEMTSFVFRETLMSHLLLWGNAYAQIVRDGRGNVLSLYPLLPDRMAVDRTAGGELFL